MSAILARVAEHGAQPIFLFDLQRQRERLRHDIDRRIAKVLDHGQFILGPEVAELEAELAAFAGVRHAIGVSSGRDALIMALMAHGIGRGDAVLVPAFTFSATAAVVVSVGGRSGRIFVGVVAVQTATWLLRRSVPTGRFRARRAGLIAARRSCRWTSSAAPRTTSAIKRTAQIHRLDGDSRRRAELRRHPPAGARRRFARPPHLRQLLSPTKRCGAVSELVAPSSPTTDHLRRGSSGQIPPPTAASGDGGRWPLRIGL